MKLGKECLPLCHKMRAGGGRHFTHKGGWQCLRTMMVAGDALVALLWLCIPTLPISIVGFNFSAMFLAHQRITAWHGGQDTDRQHSNDGKNCG